MRVAILVVMTGCTLARVAPDAPRIVQDERPTVCGGDTQPAIIGFADRPRGRIPAWTCLTGCGPRLEYVTYVTLDRKGHPQTNPQCVMVCSAATHRVSYAVGGGWEDNTCAPGPENAVQATESAREQAAQVATIIEPIELRLTAAEATLARLAGSVTWTDADLDAYNAIPRSWTSRGTRSIVEPIDGARIDALQARLAALAPRAEILVEQRASAAQHTTCVASCDDEHAACADTCAATTAAVCAACKVAHDHCIARCN